MTVKRGSGRDGDSKADSKTHEERADELLKGAMVAPWEAWNDDLVKRVMPVKGDKQKELAVTGEWMAIRASAGEVLQVIEFLEAVYSHEMSIVQKASWVRELKDLPRRRIVWAASTAMEKCTAFPGISDMLWDGTSHQQNNWTPDPHPRDANTRRR